MLGAWGVVAAPKGRPQKPGRPVYVRVANPTSSVRNPAFDVTPAELVTGLITPVGIFTPKTVWARRRELGWRG